MRHKSVVMSGVLGRLNVVVRQRMAVRRLLAVGGRGAIGTGFFTQHASRYRTPDGKQQCKQYEEPDAKSFHSCDASTGSVFIQTSRVVGARLHVGNKFKFLWMDY